MSLQDARTADEALADVPPIRRSAAQLIADRKARRRRTLARMTEAALRLVSMQGNVSSRDLLAEGFSEAEIARHFRTAAARAGLDRMVA